jgi:NitT/TauT family transport system substrate-binding protein
MKRSLICILVIICCSLLLGCNNNHSSTSGKTITIGVMPDVESIPFIIADRNGYFEEEGVQVKIEHFKSAKDRDSALQSGLLDGAISDVLAVVFANEGGINLRIVSKNDGNILLMAGKDSGIDSIDNIKGKSVGLSNNTIMEYSVDKMLEAAGISADEINKIAIPPLPTRLEMLQGGKVDAAILPEPLAGLAVKNGATVLSTTDQLANKAGAIAFIAESLQESPEEIKAVFTAYNRAVDYLNNEPLSNYIDYVIEKQGFPAELKESIALPRYTRAELPEEKIVTDVVKWLKEKELIKGDYGYGDLVDNSTLREIQ